MRRPSPACGRPSRRCVICGVAALIAARKAAVAAGAGFSEEEWAAMVARDPRLGESWRCGAEDCPGYVYEPRIGEPLYDIPPGTPFQETPAAFLCPACGADKTAFFRLSDRQWWRAEMQAG